MASRLAELQQELVEVKKALRENGAYLGMKGETLQKYLVQLSEKENLHLRAANEGLLGASGIGKGASRGHAYARPCNYTEPVVIARPAPPGDPREMDKDSLQAVIQHLNDYEASATESTRAVRALSALAYSSASNVDDDRVLPLIHRVLVIHKGCAPLELAAMRVLSNMAYQPQCALTQLAPNPDILAHLLAAIGRTPAAGCKDIVARASEAVARLVAAEAGPSEAEIQAGAVVREKPAVGEGPLCGLFLAAIGGDSSRQDAMAKTVVQLINNEVVEAPLIMKRFAEAGLQATSSPDAVVSWLSLAKYFASECETTCPAIPEAMMNTDCISTATKLMESHVSSAMVQLASIEGLSRLVGSRWNGLLAFAKAAGMRHIEVAMRSHVGDVQIQTKGIRALASGILWPEDVQKTSQYDWRNAVELTKVAMGQHVDNVELQIAGIEALGKYVDKLNCKAEVKGAGGDELIQMVMKRHAGVSKLESFGKALRDNLAK